MTTKHTFYNLFTYESAEYDNEDTMERDVMYYHNCKLLSDLDDSCKMGVVSDLILVNNNDGAMIVTIGDTTYEFRLTVTVHLT